MSSTLLLPLQTRHGVYRTSKTKQPIYEIIRYSRTALARRVGARRSLQHSDQSQTTAHQHAMYTRSERTIGQMDLVGQPPIDLQHNQLWAHRSWHERHLHGGRCSPPFRDKRWTAHQHEITARPLAASNNVSVAGDALFATAVVLHSLVNFPTL